jgi:hypothetical protein
LGSVQIAFVLGWVSGGIKTSLAFYRILVVKIDEEERERGLFFIGIDTITDK